jgi:hypothetical protein
MLLKIICSRILQEIDVREIGLVGWYRSISFLEDWGDCISCFPVSWECTTVQGKLVDSCHAWASSLAQSLRSLVGTASLCGLIKSKNKLEDTLLCQVMWLIS